MDQVLGSRLPEGAAKGEENWNQAGAAPTTEAALEAARNFTWRANPLGGLDLEYRGREEVMVSINADGSIRGVVFERLDVDDAPEADGDGPPGWAEGME